MRGRTSPERELEKLITTIAILALTIIAMTILSRMVLSAWDWLMFRLEQMGYPMPETEYFLGMLIFLLLCYAGAIKLRKLGAES